MDQAVDGLAPESYVGAVVLIPRDKVYGEDAGRCVTVTSFDFITNEFVWEGYMRWGSPKVGRFPVEDLARLRVARWPKKKGEE